MSIQVFEGDGVDHQLRHVERTRLYHFNKTSQQDVIPDLGEVEPKLLDELHAFCAGPREPLVVRNQDNSFVCFLLGKPYPGIKGRLFWRGHCGHCRLIRYAGRSRTSAALQHLEMKIRFGNASAVAYEDWDLQAEPVTVDGEPLIEFLERTFA